MREGAEYTTCGRGGKKGQPEIDTEKKKEEISPHKQKTPMDSYL